MAFNDQDQQVDLDTWEKLVFEKHGVPEGLRHSIRSQESGGDVNATSPTGVKGRYQVTQRTAQGFGLNRDDPWEQPVAAAKLLRQGFDEAKRRNPKFSDRQAWLASSASYYAGPDAFDAAGNIGTASKDGLSNPSRYAESIAQKWSEFERGASAQTPVNRASEFDPQPSTLRKVIPPGRQRTTVRGPVLPSRPASPFSISSPTGFEQAGQRAAVRASQVSPEVATEADRRGRELTRFQGRSRLGQVGEVAAGGLMQGVDQLVKAASYANPSPMGRRGVSMFTPEAQRNLEGHQAAQDVALPNTAPIVRGVAAAASQIPAVALAGPGAPIVAGGIQAANADWRDPKRAALQTVIGLVGGAAGGKLAQMAIRPATMGGRLASGVAGGAAGNVIPSAVEQMAYDGRLNPQQLAQQAVIGGVTGAVLPPGADPRLRRGGDVESRPVTPDQVFAYDENGNPKVDVNAPLTSDLVGQGVNRAGDLGATGMRRQNPVQFGRQRIPYRGGPGRGTRPMTSSERVQDRVGSALQDRVAAVEARRQYDEQTERLPEGWGQEPVRDTAILPEPAPVRPPSNPLAILQENAIEARNNAVQFEDQGDLMAAWREYDVVHKTLVDAQRQMGRPKTPEQADALTAIRREISAAAAQRDRAKKAAMAAQREASAGQRQAQVAKAALENAPTADLPPETSPLLKSVVNPEGGIPPAGESPSGLFGQLARAQAAEAAKPVRGPKDSGQLSAVEYLKRASRGEGIRVSDRGEARVLGAKEAGIVGLTNKRSKYAVSDAQVMLDEGGFNLPDGRRFTDPSVTENDVLAFLAESGREGRANTRDLDARLAAEEASYYENRPPSEPLQLASNRLPRIGDLPPSRVSQNLQPKPEVSRATPPTVLEQARQAGGSTDDLAVLDALAKRQAVERPRPAGERTVFGEPGQGGLSLSAYPDFVRRNQPAIDQLRAMDIDSVEGREIVARIEDDADRHGTERRHVDELLNTLRSEQFDDARRADRGLGSAPLRRTPTAELQEFSAQPDEVPVRSAPLQPVKREPVQVKQEASVQPVIRRNPAQSALDTAANRKDARSNVRRWLGVARDDKRSPDARKRAEGQLMKAAGIQNRDDLRAAIQDYELSMTDVERDVAAMSRENLIRAIETSDAQSARRIREGEAASRQDIEWAKSLNDERKYRVAMGTMKSSYEKRPGRGDQDVTLMKDDALAKRITDAEKALNDPRLSEARAQQLEDFLTVAERERDARAAKARTVSHPDPAIDGKPVIAETADGRVIVPNKENKTGVSVVKDRSDVSRQREDSIYESRLANAEALERRYLDELDELDEQISLAERDRLDTDEIERLYQQQAVLEEKLEGARQVVNKIINESPDVLEKEHAQSINLTAEALRIKPRVLDGAPVSLTELRSAVGPRMSKLEFDQAVTALAQQGHWAISRLVHPGYMTDAELDALVKIGDDYYIGATLSGSQSALKPKFIEEAERYLSDESKNRSSEASQVRGNQSPPMPARVTARDLAENVRAEYRPAKNRPGTIYLNDWGLEALNAAHSIEFADASGSDRITSGVNYKPEQARILAEHIRERAARPNFSDEGRKNLLTMARQIELAADDGAVSFVPMLGQGIGRARATIRHEGFHAQQRSISPQIHELTTPRWLPAQKFGAAIADRLGKLGYEKREFPAEAAAFVASGDWDQFGMSRDDARQFLADYFDDVAYRHGKDAINKFRAVHPSLQEVVEVRRGTNQPRFGNATAGLGRSIEPAVSRQRGGERSGIRVGGSSGGVPSGDAGSVRGQSQTAALRAITPESLRAGQSAPEPTPAQGRPRQGLAGIRAESLRAEGVPAPSAEAPRGRFAKGFEFLGELYHAPKSLLSSADISAAGRQGLFLSLPPSQWGRAAKATGRQFRSLVSTPAYDRFVAEVKGRASYTPAKDAGLYLATDDAGTGITGREEGFASRLIGKLPHVKYSEQAYKTYLDSIRMDTFEKYRGLIEDQPGTREQKDAALKAAADWINTSTGRGKIHGKFGESVEQATPLLNAIFFAPRYTISRFQMLNPATYARNLQSPERRVVFRQQASEMFQAAAALVATGALAKAAGAAISFDPDDADFLKLKFGNTRYDVLAGVQQTARLAVRIGDWMKEEATGKSEKALAAKRNETGGAVMRFGRTKLGPVPSFFVDWVNNWKNVSGERHAPSEVSVKNPILQRMMPLLWSDVVEAYMRGYRQGGVVKGAKTAARFAPAVAGIGVQDYERRRKRPVRVSAP